MVRHGFRTSTKYHEIEAETAQKEVEKPSDSGARAPRPEVEASLWLDVKPAAEKSEERRLGKTRVALKNEESTKPDRSLFFLFSYIYIYTNYICFQI